MKQVILGLLLSIASTALCPAIAAEYRGQNIDGQRFAATAYSHETGGTFAVEIEFKDRWATLYFVNGGERRIRLKQAEIQNLQQIDGWEAGLFNVGGFLSFKIADVLGNREAPRPRPFEGFWSVSLQEGEIMSERP